MKVLLRTHLSLAKASIKRNRSRSFLTCLGISIGVAAIILILSLTGSISSLISDEVSSLGADLIVVRPASNKDFTSNILDELTTANLYSRSSLQLSDVEAIKSIEGVAAAAPISVFTTSVTSSEDRTQEAATVLATNSDFTKIQTLTLSSGSFIIPTTKVDTVVIGSTMAMRLFGTVAPVGKTIVFEDHRFIVIGVLSAIDDPINFNNVDLDTAIIMDTKILDSLEINAQTQQINIKATSTEAVAPAAAAIDETLAKSKSDTHNFAVLTGDEITHPASSLFYIVSGVLALVAGISLIVGGIGVMNIMLVSVAERSHEVGIRKAVGASGPDIFWQFLFESLILCLLGGFLGLIFAYVLAFFICLITPFNPFISWQIIAITLGTSVGVGTLFGLYPAIKASRRSPIASLKSYH